MKTHKTIWPNRFFAEHSTKKKMFFASGETPDEALDRLQKQIDLWEKFK